MTAPALTLPLEGARPAIELRDYQQAALDAVLRNWRERGITRQLVSLPTGAGKTVLAAHLIGEAGLDRALMMVHRDELVRQSVQALRDVSGIESIGVVKADRDDVYADVVVASAQTIARASRLDRLRRALAGQSVLFISDECFPAGTLVDGRPIESIEVGDYVTAWSEASGGLERRPVTRVFTREYAGPLCEIVTADGRFTCTPEHPIYTLRGWVAAREVCHGDYVLSVQGVRGSLPAEGSGPAPEDGVLAGVLDSGRAGTDGRDKPEARLYAHAGAQPHGGPGDPRAHERDAPRDRAPADGSRRQREGAHRPATDVACPAGAGVGAGGIRAHLPGPGFGLAEPLHDRHRSSGLAHRGGSGWREPLGPAETTGRPEGQLPTWKRVDRTEVHERPRAGVSGRRGSGSLVYNLEVEGLHTYTANGFVVHNCHHDAAPTRRNAIETIAPDLLVGLTATPKRGDGVGLDGVYQEIAAHVPMLELIALERLAPLKGLRVESAVDLDGVHTRGGEFVERELADAVNNAARNRLIVESWQRHAAGRKRTVAFCVDVAHAEALRDAFRGAGVTSEAILGSTPSDERQRLLSAFHDGHIAVLTNCMVLTEGYDEPRIDCVLMTRPTKSQALYVQCVGRAARRAPGYKDDALIIDFVDNTARHRLVSLPSLAGSDSPDKEAGKDSPAAPGDEPSEADRKAGEVIDLLSLAQSKQRMREVAARHVNLFAASPFKWRPLADGVLMAPADRGQYVLLVQRGGDEGYQPLRLDMGQAGGGPSYEWLFPRALDFEMAAGIAEGKASLNQLTQRDAAWGRLAATEKQVEYARRVGVRYEKGMTRGEISEAIDRARVIRAIKRLNLGGGQ